MHPSRLAFVIAVTAGTALWSATSIVSTRPEPWDASGYWTVAYPMAIALAAVLGYLAPDRPWRWAVVIMFTQVIVMIGGGSGFGLLPLGLLLIAVLSGPAVFLAKCGAALRARLDADEGR